MFDFDNLNKIYFVKMYAQLNFQKFCFKHLKVM